jgi:AhpD family alkylhydroperoxidase
MDVLARGTGLWRRHMGTAKTMVKGDVHSEIKELFGTVPVWVDRMPETALAGFWGMYRDFYLAETKIPNKYKELIGIGISGATRCRYCVLFHTEAARLHGATDEEIHEASFMAGVTMMASTFLNAEAVDFDQFRKETLGIIDYVKSHQGPTAKGHGKGRAAHA